MMTAPTRYGEVDLLNCPHLKGPYGIINTVRFVSPSKYAIRIDEFIKVENPTLILKGVKIMDNYGELHGPFWTEFISPHARSNGNPWGNAFVCGHHTPSEFSTPLSPLLIDLLKSDIVLPIMTELTKKDDIIKEKDDRIATLETRVRELELFEAKVKALEAQIEYTAIPHIHLVSSKPTDSRTDAALIDFFSVPPKDIDENLPEFVHESS